MWCSYRWIKNYCEGFTLFSFKLEASILPTFRCLHSSHSANGCWLEVLRLQDEQDSFSSRRQRAEKAEDRQQPFSKARQLNYQPEKSLLGFKRVHVQYPLHYAEEDGGVNYCLRLKFSFHFEWCCEGRTRPPVLDKFSQGRAIHHDPRPFLSGWPKK